MYCYHCGYKIDEKKIESKKSTRKQFVDVASFDTKINYVCPRCGHLIHEGCDEKDTKSLSVACHAELQRGRNDLARGMSSLTLAVTLGVTGFIFLLLSRKADLQMMISTTCPEFWVALVLGVVAVILLGLGGFLTYRGVSRKVRYTNLLKDINTKTFVQ